DGLVAFHYSSYGTFCLHSKSSIISTVVLPTTEIVEPVKKRLGYCISVSFLDIFFLNVRN
ncbi:hypothetical protein, partial [Streptococcus salivarius]|uniref:hypothetical protein n=1 Tax=Streptococcus salivarius TaxID=1304 RepID=UPI0019D5D31C